MSTELIGDKGSQSPDQSRATRVVVAGEVNSGKSAVVNALVRDQIVPDFFGQEIRPVVLLTYGPEQVCEVYHLDGTSQVIEDWSTVSGLNDVSYCSVTAPLENLRDMEILEVPFVHDGEIGSETLELVGTADVLVWVTIASQAWRLSEKTIVDQFAALEIPRKVLAVSRGDKLRSANDRDRIGERLRTETGGRFSDIIFMQAGKKVIKDSKTNPASWEATKGKELFHRLEQLAAEALAEPEGEPTDSDQSADIIPFSEPKFAASTPATSPVPAEVEGLAPEHEALGASVASVHGTVAALLLTADDEAVVLGGRANMAERAADVARRWREAYENVPSLGEEPMDIQVKMNGYTMFLRSKGHGGDILVFVTDNSKVAAGIASTAFARMVL